MLADVFEAQRKIIRAKEWRKENNELTVFDVKAYAATLSGLIYSIEISFATNRCTYASISNPNPILVVHTYLFIYL